MLHPRLLLEEKLSPQVTDEVYLTPALQSHLIRHGLRRATFPSRGRLWGCGADLRPLRKAQASPGRWIIAPTVLKETTPKDWDCKSPPTSTAGRA